MPETAKERHAKGEMDQDAAYNELGQARDTPPAAEVSLQISTNYTNKLKRPCTQTRHAGKASRQHSRGANQLMPHDIHTMPEPKQRSQATQEICHPRIDMPIAKINKKRQQLQQKERQQQSKESNTQQKGKTEHKPPRTATETTKGKVTAGGNTSQDPIR